MSKNNKENLYHCIRSSDCNYFCVGLPDSSAFFILYGQASLNTECTEHKLKLPVQFCYFRIKIIVFILGLMKTRVLEYKNTKRPTVTRRSLIITRLSTITPIMARCHQTMCTWWAWGCQQQQQCETGTTLSLARHLQTSRCYTSSLPSHFICEDTQEGVTYWEARN